MPLDEDVACGGRDDQVDSSPQQGWRGWRFWAVFPGLCFTTLLISLDATVLTTALPTIVGASHSSSLYIWAINAYTLSFTAVQPLYGQAADIFGRKPTIVASNVLFIIGSAVCGASSNTRMFIAGRAIQGLGSGGLSILPAMILSDLVPLRKRQLYTGILYGAFALGTFSGPVIGGALVVDVGWQWIFWLNLPVSGLAILLILFFLRVHHGRPTQQSFWSLLSRFDYVGDALLVAAVTAILLSLSSLAPWSDWRTLLPLILGCLGLVSYIWFKSSRKELRLFSNRTSAAALLLTFLHGILLYWASYFLPIYFQAVRLATPLESGVNTLPAAAPMIPFGIIGAAMITRTGLYRLNQMIGFVLSSIALGCFSLLDQHTPTAVWAVLQIIFAAGAGVVLTATLPAIQAPLPEKDVAAATAAWGFIQSLGFVFGAAIPSGIFESRFSLFLATVRDREVQAALAGKSAYEHATRVYIGSLPMPVQSQVIHAFSESLKLVWQVSSAFSVLGFFVSMLLKDVKLRETLDTRYGLKEESA